MEFDFIDALNFKRNVDINMDACLRAEKKQSLALPLVDVEHQTNSN